MSSSATIDEVKRILSMLGTSLDVIDAIGERAEAVLGTTPTLEEVLPVLSGIAAVVRVVRGALDGTITQTDAETAIAQFGAALASNNQAARDAVDAKFPRDTSAP